MCGHVGIAGNLELKDENTLKKLLMFDYFRGPDSTGVAVFRKNGETRLAKMASHPINLFDSKKYTEAVNAYASSVFIGHNRAATKGAVNDYNAHPYDCGHIVGAHNGTLTLASWDKLQDMIGEKTGTDSHAIFLAIAKFGIEETVKHLQGAWALVWFDKSDNTLNFLRNKERPFWYAHTADFKKLLWASEHWMIQAAIRSSSTAYELFVSDKGFSYWQTEENWHYRYDLEELAKGSEGKPKARCKELKGKEPEPVKTTTTYHQNFPIRGLPAPVGQASGTTSTTNSRGTSTDSTIKMLRVADSNDPVDPFKGLYTVERFEYLSKYGCSWCHGDIELGDPVVVFDAHDKILCKKCSPNNGGKARIYLTAERMAENASIAA